MSFHHPQALKNASKSSFSRRQTYLAIAAISQLLITGHSYAAPGNGNVVHGDGDIWSPSSQTTTIEQRSSYLAINWDSFNVRNNQTVKFNQPDASSIAINRVVGNSQASTIAGAITSIGHVILIDPHGVIFERGANINVGGLIASGLDIQLGNDEDIRDVLASGQLTFISTDKAGGVVNRGAIEAQSGDITLLGKSVENAGQLLAKQGNVSLMAGAEAVLSFGDELLGVQLTEAIWQEDLADPAVRNTGDITANGGHILLTASVKEDLFSRAVNSGDLPHSPDVLVHDDGSFTLGRGGDVVNSGTLNVSAEDGVARVTIIGESVENSGDIYANSDNGDEGKIELFAHRKVMLAEDSNLDASDNITIVSAGDVQIDGFIGDNEAPSSVLVKAGNNITLSSTGSINSGTQPLAEPTVLLSAGDTGWFDGADNMSLSPDPAASSETAETGLAGIKIDGSITTKGGIVELRAFYDADAAELDGADTLRAAVDVAGTIATTGGDLIVGSEDNRVGSFTSTNTLRTDSSTVGGEISIYAEHDIQISSARFGGTEQNSIADVGNLVADTRHGNIGLQGNYEYNSVKDGAQGEIRLIAHDGSIQVQEFTADDGPSGQSRLDISLDARRDINIQIGHNGGAAWLNGGNFVAESRSGNIDIQDGSGLLTEGGDIDLRAHNDLNMLGDLETAGGSVLLNAGHDISSTKIVTDGGDVTVESGHNVTLNYIDTSAGWEIGGKVEVTNTSSFQAQLIQTRGGKVAITADSILSVNQINTSGGSGQAGGDISLSSSAIELDNLSSSAGRSLNRQAGTISLLAQSNQEANIVINGSILARNSDGSAQAAELLLSSTCNSCNNKVIFNGSNLSESSLVKILGSVQGHNTIQVTNAPSHWTIDEHNGQIKDLGGSWSPVTFNGFNTLIGSLASDTFEIASEPVGAITIYGYDPSQSSLAGDTLIGLSRTSVSNTWTINGLNSGTLNAGTGPQINFHGFSSLQGGSGDDNFIITGNGYAETINGNGGDNTLTGPDTTAEWLITGVNKGHLHYGPGEAEIEFKDTQTVVAGSNNNTLIGTDDLSHWNITGAGAGALSIMELDETLIAELIQFDGMHNLHGGDNGNTFVIAEPGSILGVIQGGSGRDKLVDETTKSSVWSVTGLASGRITGTDEPANVYVDEFKDIEVFVGGSGVNTLDLSGSTTSNSWLINDKDTGRVTTSNGSVYVEGFIGFVNLIGGFGEDTFIFGSNQAEVSGWIDGGGGSNKLDISSLNDIQNYIVELGANSSAANIQITNIADVNAGNDGQARLMVAYGDNEWNIEGLNRGAVNGVTFTGFADLVGGSGTDVFTIASSAASVSGKLNGNGGINTIVGSSSITKWFVETENAGRLSYDNGASSTAFENIQQIIAGSDSDTIIGANVLGRWDITGAGHGRLSKVDPDGSVIAELIQFYGMHNLQGGNDDDTFIVGIDGSIDGEVRGGLGANRLIGKDGSNTWLIIGENSGTLGVTGGSNYIGRFIDISTLGGGVFDDTFVFSSHDAFVGTINGGEGVNRIVGVDVDTDWFMTGENKGYFTSSFGKHLEGFKSIHEILGGSQSNTLVGPDLESWWHINSVDSGTLSSNTGGAGFVELIAFEGINNLRGGDNSDSFLIQKDGSISGSIYGGAGNDTLGIERDISIIWTISDVNAGVVKDEGGNTDIARFRDVENLEGGSGDDRFVFASVNAELTGLINGGSGYNSIDGRPGDTDWILDETSSNSGVATDALARKYLEFSNIQLLNGNSGYKNRLIGPNQESDWRIAGIGSGNVSTRAAPLDKMDFSGVTSLIGGDDNDTFTFDGGYIRDIVDGGKGDDTFILTDESVGSSVMGGEGKDKIILTINPDALGELLVSDIEDLTLNGGNANYKADHMFRDASNGTLQYSQGGQDYRVLYSGAEQVVDRVEAETLIVHGRATVADKVLLFDNNKYRIKDNSADIEFSNKTNVTFDAQTDDIISLDGVITVSGALTFKNVAIESLSGVLNADQLYLDGTSSVGSSSKRLHTRINDLFLAGVSGALYIDETDDLNLAQAVIDGDIDILLGGSLTSNTLLSGSYDIVIDSGGDIKLNGQNKLSGRLALAATGEITFKNNTSSNFTHLSANSAKIESTGDIKARSGISIEALAVLSSDGDITLNDASNRLGSVRIDKARSVSLSSALGFTVEDIKASGSVGVFSGDYLTLAGNLRSDADLSVEAVGGIDQRGALNGRTIALRSAGRLAMGPSAKSTASEWINYEAQEVSLGHLVAQAIDIGSGSVITDSNGDRVNVEAKRLNLTAASGIGGSDGLETMVDQLFVSNDTGTTRITNGKEVWISSFRSNGNVHFQNTNGDVHLVRDPGQTYQRYNSDAQLGGGLIDVNYEIGTLTIDVDNGNLLTADSPDLNYPVLAARNMRLTTPRGGIGQPLYPLVLYVKDNLILVSARPSWIRYAFEAQPTSIDDSGSISGDIADLIGTGNEQLVEIEALADIDPAVFSNVRNYGFDDIAIRLPDDQLYYLDDED